MWLYELFPEQIYRHQFLVISGSFYVDMNNRQIDDKSSGQGFYKMLLKPCIPSALESCFLYFG